MALDVEMKNALKNAPPHDLGFYSRAVLDSYAPTPETGKEKTMSDEQALVFDRNEAVSEGDPRQFVLRGDADCDALLNELEGLGVTHFRCLIHARADDGCNSSPETPSFKRGARLSDRRLEQAKRLAKKLCDLVADSVTEAVEGTSAEGSDLLIEANVIVSDPDGPRGILAWVTVVGAYDPEFNSREIEIL